MKRIVIPFLFSISILTGCSVGTGSQPAFRVRSDFSVPLNSDQGWAGAINENVTIQADQPFRVRFEAESPSQTTGDRQFRLQYRRNQGDWTDVEAHDFPHPLREIDVDFKDADIGSTAKGWRTVSSDPSGLAVTLQDSAKVLQTRADNEPLIVLYESRWPAIEMAAEFRLPVGAKTGVGFVFGYVDAANHYRVLVDPAAGAIRLSRVAGGVETVITERKAKITAGEWLAIEVQSEAEEVEVNYQDGLVEFTAKPGGSIPSTQFGFFVPAGGKVAFREFAFAGEAKTPGVSIVSCPAYQNGAATSDLLKGSSAGFIPGVGISLEERTAPWTAGGTHGEFEWPLVVRRFADGAVTNEEGDTFELRMVEAGGAPLGDSRNPVLRLSIPPGHVGGTFVETPGRIGPFQASNGDLYFIMEPAETDNLFMMIKSTDGGMTWREVDAANRPATGDLESVDARQVGDSVHIIHQVTRSTRYHSFRTSDHPTHPDTWKVRDEPAAEVNSIAQAATLVVRSDGSMVTFYVGPTVHYSIRSAAGVWSADTVVDGGAPPILAGPRAVLGAKDVVHVAYYSNDGRIWYRRLLPNGSLTPRQQLAAGAGKTRAEYGAVLPLLYIPETNTVVIIYRLGDGNLWERRIVNNGPPTPAVKVTDRRVVTDAVDSQQPGADAVLDGGTVRVFFIDESTRDIWSTHDEGGWQPSTLRVDGILGSWVRGNVYTGRNGARVYGYVYDAGSDGGAGMNRFGEVVLTSR
jgi:hypothetical protein